LADAVGIDSFNISEHYRRDFMDSVGHVMLAAIAGRTNASGLEIAGGSLYVGSPETVAIKLAAAIRLLGLSRFDLAYALGRVPHEQRMATIALYGREVIPRVRELLAAAPEEMP